MEAIRDILKRRGIEIEAKAKEIEEGAREKYREEYGLRRLPSEYEVMRIEYIKRRQAECGRCKGLRECQYEAGGEGFTPIVMIEEIGGVKELYFGVKKCRYEVEREEEEKEAALYRESGLPVRSRGVRLEEVMKGEVAERIKLLIKLRKDIYLRVRGERIEEVVSGVGREVMREGLRVRYKNERELLIELRVTNERYHEVLREVMEAEVLILEGLKVEQTRYNIEQLEVIIGSRRRRGLMSIVMSEEWKREQREEIRRELRGYEEMET